MTAAITSRLKSPRSVAPCRMLNVSTLTIRLLPAVDCAKAPPVQAISRRKKTLDFNFMRDLIGSM
jgi:hypothetical protein